MIFSKKLLLSACVAVSLATGACGGKTPDAKAASGEKTMEDDPITLLPAPAVAVAVLDAKGLAAHPTFGKDLGAFEDKYIPIGEESGFKASRDIERVYAAAYSLQGADILGVLVGKFDEAKIRESIAKQSTKWGSALVTTPYAGKEIYTMNNGGIAILSGRVALSGTEAAIRRSLDRIRDKKNSRDIDAWMVTTLETSDAAFAGAADFSAGALKDIRSPVMPIEGIMQMQRARVVGNLKDPGINVAIAITYADEATAGTAKEQIDKLKKLLPLVGAIGIPAPQALEVKNEKADVQITFGLNGAAIATFITRTAPQFMPNMPAGTTATTGATTGANSGSLAPKK